MSSRPGLWLSSRRSVSPRVPTVEYARSERSWAKSSQAARNSRLSSARAAGSRRCHAGSSLKKVNLAKVRSGTPAMVVLGVVLLLGAAPAASAARDPAHVTIAVVPGGTSVGELGQVPGMGVGILSAGIGDVPRDQTYLDVGQGTRIQQSLYDRPLPRISFTAGARGGRAQVRPETWQRIVDRAESAPADLIPGLFGKTLFRHGGVRMGLGHGAGAAGIILAGRRGSVVGGCLLGCSTVTVTSASLAD